MEKIISKPQDTRTARPKVNRKSKLFTHIITAIEEKKGEAVISLDLRKIDEAVADFFILCEAQSNTQIRAIAEEIKKELEDECSETPYRIEYGDSWTLIDYVNIVVHIFQRDQRKFYDLESLWLDAERVDHT